MSTASSLSRQFLRAWRPLSSRPTTTTAAAFARTTIAHGCRYSTEAEAPKPPLLVKIKEDLKPAMRAKDAPRLAVLRAVLASTLNASKTASPIATDVALVALLKKMAGLNREAAEGFIEANRVDLAEKEEAQIRILEEYIAQSGVESVSDDALRAIIVEVIAGLPADKKGVTGEVMRRVMAADGPLAGKDVNKSEVAKMVAAVIAEEKSKSS